MACELYVGVCSAMMKSSGGKFFRAPKLFIVHLPIARIVSLIVGEIDPVK
jgi:hypothetical protein